MDVDVEEEEEVVEEEEEEEVDEMNLSVGVEDASLPLPPLPPLSPPLLCSTMTFCID